MSMLNPINPGAGQVRKNAGAQPKPKMKNAEIAANATGLSKEVFETTERSGLESQVLQGKIAAKMGVKPKEVSVRSDGFTFTGKALDKMRESANEMAGKAGSEMSGVPGWATNKNIAQLYYAPGQTPDGKKFEIEGDPATSVSVPDPHVGLVTKGAFLANGGEFNLLK